MFAFQNKSDMVRVGERNVEASKKKLRELGIPLKAQDTGLSPHNIVVKSNPLTYIIIDAIAPARSMKKGVIRPVLFPILLSMILLKRYWQWVEERQGWRQR